MKYFMKEKNCKYAIFLDILFN